MPRKPNARTHSESQIAQIAASIKEFGFLSPILIAEDSMILAGHGSQFFLGNKGSRDFVRDIMQDILKGDF